MFDSTSRHVRRPLDFNGRLLSMQYAQSKRDSLLRHGGPLRGEFQAHRPISVVVQPATVDCQLQIVAFRKGDVTWRLSKQSMVVL
jgi:hypothetical protein